LKLLTLQKANEELIHQLRREEREKEREFMLFGEFFELSMHAEKRRENERSKVMVRLRLHSHRTHCYCHQWSLPL